MRKNAKISLFIYFLLWFLYLAHFWSNALTIEPSGAVITNHINIWGDWAAHLTMASRMAWGKSLILAHSPFLITYPFSYPFVANLIPALMARLGLNLFFSMKLTSFIYGFTGVVLLFIFLKRLFKSNLTAVLGSILYYFNGGLGFIKAIGDLQKANNLLSFLENLPHRYAHQPETSMYVYNVINSMFIPQRAFALGFPVTLFILIFILDKIDNNFFHKRYFSWLIKLKEKILASFKIRSRQQKYIDFIRAFVIGLLIGATIIIHTHSFLFLAIVLSVWSISSLIFSPQSKRKIIFRFWLTVLIGSGLTAIPLYYHFFAHNIHHNFMEWFPGWYAKEDRISWLWFWFWNWGPVLIAGLIGYLMLITKKIKEKDFTLSHRIWLLTPFWITFILVNLIKFQPNIWDNTKLWAWSAVGIAGLAGYAYNHFWEFTSSLKIIQKIALRILLVFVFLVTISSAALDLIYITDFKHHNYTLYSAQETALATWAQQYTPNTSIWLTGDQHNHCVDNLSGRQTLMGYRGWLWTQGYQYYSVEADVMQMFQHPLQSQDLFKKYNISYVVIGPQERNEWHANTTDFSKFNLVNSSSVFQVYEVNFLQN